MCGRYGRSADRKTIVEQLQAHDASELDDSYFAPSYNVAPQSMQPVVRLDDETGERELTIMRWGLIPFWSKDSRDWVFHDQRKGRNHHYQSCFP